jgi:flavin-dependent dehydrogenase
MMHDLVVVGGGPVGLATALYAERAGLDTVVLEPRDGAIDKACGEGLMPGAVAMLAALDVHPAGMPFRGIRYVSGERRAEARFRDGTGLGVRRTGLHTALRDRVDAVGVPVRREAVTSVRQEQDHVIANGTRARFLVAADGLHSPTRRRLGLDLPARGTRRYGLRAHVATPPWTDHVEVHWSPTAEAYVTPVGPATVGVALLTSTREGFAEQLRRFPDLQAKVGPLTWSPLRGAGPLRQRSRRRVAGRVLLAGDAAGYVDALTGEGISIGLRQARAAVEAVATGDPARYETAWRRVTWRYETLTRALLGVAGFPPSRRALVPAAAALPWVFSAAVNELGRGS